VDKNATSKFETLKLNSVLFLIFHSIKKSLAYPADELLSLSKIKLLHGHSKPHNPVLCCKKQQLSPKQECFYLWTFKD